MATHKLIYPSRATHQFFRYAVVGLGSNLVLYLLYLLLTAQGMGAKVAMTSLYVLGVVQTFFLNKKWTFRHDGRVSRALRRYVASYALGYAINLIGLMLLVDRLGMAHQLVQGVMIVALAIMLFLSQKFWVFAGEARDDRLQQKKYAKG